MTGTIRIRVDDRAVMAGLAAAKRVVTKEANRELKAVVEHATLPTAKRLSPRVSGRLAGRLRAGAAGNRAYIQNTTPYAGLIEFGGTRRDVIKPRNAKALSFGGQAVASVSTPRTYQGQHRIAAAIELTAQEVLDSQLDAVARAIATATGGSLS